MAKTWNKNMVFKNIFWKILCLSFTYLLCIPVTATSGDLRAGGGGRRRGAATDFRSNFPAFSHYGFQKEQGQMNALECLNFGFLGFFFYIVFYFVRLKDVAVLLWLQSLRLQQIHSKLAHSWCPENSDGRDELRPLICTLGWASACTET